MHRDGEQAHMAQILLEKASEHISTHNISLQRIGNNFPWQLT